jgi:ribosomal protein S18 acetylase RimI-like enzyme
MLQLHPNCQCCDCDLPPDSNMARICSFECTYCAHCAEQKLHGICPNCGGELRPRPVRPNQHLLKHPASAQRKPLANCSGPAVPAPDASAEGLNIRRADLNDCTELAPLFDGYRQFYQQNSDLSGAHAFIQARLQRAESVILVARVARAAVGFCQLYPIFSSVSMGRAYLLNDLFVEPAARRTGAGRRLLNAAVSHAQAEGAHWLMLQTAVDNEAAQALYEDSGWQREQAFWTYQYTL